MKNGEFLQFFLFSQHYKVSFVIQFIFFLFLCVCGVCDVFAVVYTHIYVPRKLHSRRDVTLSTIDYGLVKNHPFSKNLLIHKILFNTFSVRTQKKLTKHW